MKTMKIKAHFAAILGAWILAGAALSAPQTVFAAQGTDGTEMHVLQPQQLEIQLGSDWVGVEFQLKTDAGLYPGTIPVGEDGVLRLEIGGSTAYILTCLNSSTPSPDAGHDPAAVESDPETGSPSDTETEPDSEAEHSEVADLLSSAEEPNAIAGIPVLHIALFSAGLLIAVAALVGMHLASRRHAVDAEYEEEDDD